MKMRTIVFLILVLLIVIFFALPHITHKETYTLEQASSQWAKGKTVTVDGSKIHYIEKGEGNPVILIHGFLYHTVMWKQNIDTLAQKFKVYAVDLWGWGFSDRLKETDYSFDRYGKQIIGFMDALKIPKASLVGQSMGGGISVYTAARYPDRVDRLILVDAAVLPNPMTTIGRIYQLPYVGEFLNAIPGNAVVKSNIKSLWFYDPKKVTDEYVEEVARPLAIKGTPAGMMYILRNVLKDPYVQPEAEKLAQYGKPILIVHGRQDKAVPLERSEKLNAMWRGSRLVIFEQAGHTPHEEYPEKFNRLALGFLSE
jgi:pimeloyl-ACP methyl ester carboxylesterase